jgi:hypothetical protein
MDLIDDHMAWADRAFYFSGQLTPPLLAKLWRFRSDEQYDADEHAENTALTLVRRFASCVKTGVYFIMTSDIERPSLVRSKKGLLWNYDGLRQLPYTTFELNCSEGRTRLVAVVDLSRFEFESDAGPILNWGRGLIVFAPESLEHLKTYSKNWISTNINDVLGFDYDAVATSLCRNAGMAIMRYLPPSQSRLETIVIVGSDGFVDAEMQACVECIT